MASFFPRSLWWFLATLVTALLLRSPIPGFWLLFLGAPLWPILTLNFGFISLGIEAVTRKTHIIWLIAPLIWFIGYGYVAWESHKAIGVLEDQVRAFNGEKRISFDPTKQSLVIDPTLDIDNNVVRNLLRGYDLPVLYSVRRGIGSHPAVYTAWRISRTESCRSINDSHRFDTPVRGLELELNFGPYPSKMANTCFYSMKEDPPTPQITFSASYEKKHLDYLEYTATAIKLSDAAGTTELLSDSTTPYQWFPLPFAGCFLDSGAPSWECDVGFLKEKPVLVTGNQVDTAAHALGLKSIPPITEAEVQQRANKQLEASLFSLTEFLADPSKPITGVEMRALVWHPDRYAPKASAMVTALGKVLSEPQPRLEIASGLGQLLATLPDDQFNPIVPQILSTYAAAPNIDANVIRDRMAFRLGSVGEPALPVLERLAFDHKESLPGPIFALCMVGPAAARDGEKIAEHLHNNKRSDSDHEAAFIALLRLGRAELLNNESDVLSKELLVGYDVWRKTITPSSPKTVCSGPRGGDDF